MPSESLRLPLEDLICFIDVPCSLYKCDLCDQLQIDYINLVLIIAHNHSYPIIVTLVTHDNQN